LALVAGGATLGTPAAALAAAPAVSDSWVAKVTASSVEVRGLVNPGGAETSARVEYLTATAYQANLSATPPREAFAGALKAPVGVPLPLGSGNSDLPYARAVGGLQAQTAYRYRIVASNADGTVPGSAGAFTTWPSVSSFSLLDGRRWEMVSPPEKNGGEVAAPESLFGGGVAQAAADGQSVTFGSAASFGAAAGSPGASQYVARRTTAGWSTENVTLAAPSGAYGDHPDGVPYQLFSPDLSRALVREGRRCADGDPCPRGYLLRTGSGGSLGATPAAPDLALAGSTRDAEQAILSTCAALTGNAIEVPGSEGCDPAATNLYRWSPSGLTLLNLLPGDTQGTPGAALAAPTGAVSSDGYRVYFTVAGNLYLRQGTQTLAVDAGVGGGGSFQVASAEGSVALLTKAGHLYRFDASTQAVTDLTPGGAVQGVLGASADGSRVYYATASGVVLRQGATTTPVAAAADASNYPPAGGRARVSADGTRLAFLSSASLTGFDSAGNAEVYVYDAGSGTLSCASCNPSGERPSGPATLPGAVVNGSAPPFYKPRALAAGGDRVFFESPDALAPQDTNGKRDVYQWEAQGIGDCGRSGGCIGLISSGTAPSPASFVDASADGGDAFFLTDASLVPGDPEALDLYDARVGGGLPAPPVPFSCLGDACQPIPSEPEDPLPGTLLQRAQGNQAPVIAKPKKKVPKKKRAKHHRGKKRKGAGGRTGGAGKKPGGRR
jgi:Tol biopolymer transport system component